METLLPPATRPQGIHFVKVECNLDFSTLKTNPNSRSNIQFYAELPKRANTNNLVEGTDYPSEVQLLQALDDVLNAAIANEEAAVNAGGDLRPFHVATLIAQNNRDLNRNSRNNALADIATRANSVNFNGDGNWLQACNTVEDVKASLLETSPFLLSEPAFDSNIALVDEKKFQKEFIALIMEVAYLPLKEMIFEYVCPSLKNEPFMLFKSVCQESPDKDDASKVTILSVQQYSDIFNGLMNSLPTETVWPIDVHEFYVSNKAQDLRERMEADGYKSHQVNQSKMPYDQIKLIEEARKRALLAEKTLESQVRLIQNQLQNSHGFFLNSGEKVMFSPAEKTMKYYKNELAEPKTVVPCWGCKSTDHRWYDSILKQVVCPRRNDPSCQKRAEEAREKFKKMKKIRATNIKNGKRKVVTSNC